MEYEVSVVIPTYKRPQGLRRLLRSIARQTFSNFEVIIVNDCPDDVACESILEESWPFELNVVSNEVNRGAPYSRNRGIGLARAELVALVDDDDEWLPEKLEKQVCQFHHDLSLGLSYTWTFVENASGERLKVYNSTIQGYPKQEILRECFIPSPSVVIRKSLLLRCGGFDESFPSCQDWDTWIRLIHSNAKVNGVFEYLTIYHKHGGDSIGDSPKAFRGYNMLYRKHFGKYLAVLRVEGVVLLLKQIYRNILRWT